MDYKGWKDNKRDCMETKAAECKHSKLENSSLSVTWTAP